MLQAHGAAEAADRHAHGAGVCGGSGPEDAPLLPLWGHRQYS